MIHRSTQRPRLSVFEFCGNLCILDAFIYCKPWAVRERIKAQKYRTVLLTQTLIVSSIHHALQRAFFVSLLFVPVILAAPSALVARVARRRGGHQSQINNHLEEAVGVVSNAQYNGNWAGAVWSEGAVHHIFFGLFCYQH